MFKLLTEEERQKVAHEYVIRRTVVMLGGVILVLVAGIVGFLPAYMFLIVEENEALELTRTMNTTGQKRGDEPELHAWLAKINHELKVLSPELDADRPSDFIGEVLNERIAGIAITSFSWVKVKDKIVLSVGGLASDRQSLITFQNRLNVSGHFSDVVLPVSNLARDKDIDFQIKFSPGAFPPDTQKQ